MLSINFVKSNIDNYERFFQHQQREVVRWRECSQHYHYCSTRLLGLQIEIINLTNLGRCLGIDNRE
jgi:hypothetical protein